ncbi:serine/arginine repetitive matrix protein 2 [Nocardioides sp. NPDC057767]|uniref:serine/arginine repetitive matrix protein 2 n=1 Tax=unclassified Nocardioides TaxID=2615069 RepID=UPI003326C6AA
MSFVDSEGLRSLLFRLYGAGPDAWRDDPEVAELMAYTMEKYGALARRHGFEPADAAAAAYEVLRTRPVRKAEDPWAVVTHAVQITMIAEDRAAGLLCSEARVRKADLAGFHDAQRLSDREHSLADYHLAFQVPPAHDLAILLADAERAKKEQEKENAAKARRDHEAHEGGGEPDDDTVGNDDGPVEDGSEKEAPNAFFALDQIVEILVEFGWPEQTARAAMEYIGSRLMMSGTRQAAYERLRRERQPWLRFDLDLEVWGTLLRAVLGSPDPDRAKTLTGKGMWWRFCKGHETEQVLADTSLRRALVTSARYVRRRRSHV